MLSVVRKERGMQGDLPEEGLHVVGADADDDPDDVARLDGSPTTSGLPDSDLETLRDEFVDSFNTRNLDALLALVRPDVECPDIRDGDGPGALADELQSIWERWPGAILTRAFVDESPCAVGWLPDEDGCWSRAALVCFDSDDGLLSLVAVPDDAAALEAAQAEDPRGEEVDEWSDWAEWDRGEETDTSRRP
jgi:hypothetical protein